MNKIEYEKLINDIVYFRAAHDLSQGQFAKLCNVSTQTIYSIENGLQTPSKVTEAKIRMVLNGGVQ